MSTKSSATRYGSVAILIHWSSALAVVLAFAAGIVMSNGPQPVPPSLLLAHITLGVIVFALTLLRILWWAVADRRPGPPAGEPASRVLAANVVHGLLYVLLILMATSGITTVILSGALPLVLNGAPVPDFSELIPRAAHGIMSKILLLLLAAHIGAALWHQFIHRDRLLARMGVGRA